MERASVARNASSSWMTTASSNERNARPSATAVGAVGTVDPS
jgi:hypothetical protein